MSRNKYNARKCEADGIQFDSLAERGVYQWLKTRQENGEISRLTCHPKYELQPAFVDSDGKKHRPITYSPDFEYWDEQAWQYVVTEVKGGKATQTQAYRLRMKLFRYKYPNTRFELVEM